MRTAAEIGINVSCRYGSVGYFILLIFLNYISVYITDSVPSPASQVVNISCSQKKLSRARCSRLLIHVELLDANCRSAVAE
jgi:hypothetical protein